MDEIVNNSRQVVYAVDGNVKYRSIYGYPKRLIKVCKLQPGQFLNDQTPAFGYIKEERILDEHGDVVTTVFHEKNGWRNVGNVRFYASPEALLIACGLLPILGRGNDEKAQLKARGVSQQPP